MDIQEVKALSLKQPWGYLLFHGKPVENRKWATNYRGPLLIHASKNYDKEGELWVRQNFPEIEIPTDLPMGAIIGIVTISDCVKSYPSKWFFGPYGFVIAHHLEFVKAIPHRGQLGVFKIPNDVVREVISETVCRLSASTEVLVYKWAVERLLQ